MCTATLTRYGLTVVDAADSDWRRDRWATGCCDLPAWAQPAHLMTHHLCVRYPNVLQADTTSPTIRIEAFARYLSAGVNVGSDSR